MKLSSVLSSFLRRMREADAGPEGTSDPPVADVRVGIRAQASGPIAVSWFPDSQTPATVAGTLENCSALGMGLRLEHPLPVGTLIWVVRSDVEVLKGVVRHCTEVEDGVWRVGVRLVREERRRGDRTPVHGLAQLKRQGPDGASLVREVEVVDLSDSGVGLLASEPVPCGQIVQLIGREFSSFAAVRFCVEIAQGRYRAGLLFVRPPHSCINRASVDWID